MNKLLFIYIIFCYLLASIFTLQNSISIENQLIGCLSLIILFGIPHGAIDNVLSLSESNLSNRSFYSLYLLSMIFYAVLWFIFPLEEQKINQLRAGHVFYYFSFAARELLDT